MNGPCAVLFAPPALCVLRAVARKAAEYDTWPPLRTWTLRLIGVSRGAAATGRDRRAG